MEIIILLIGISLSVAIGFLVLFIWNLKSGQYDDIESPSIRMLFDDKMVKSTKRGSDPERDKTQLVHTGHPQS